MIVSQHTYHIYSISVFPGTQIEKFCSTYLAYLTHFHFYYQEIIFPLGNQPTLIPCEHGGTDNAKALTLHPLLFHPVWPIKLIRYPISMAGPMSTHDPSKPNHAFSTSLFLLDLEHKVIRSWASSPRGKIESEKEGALKKLGHD